MIAAGNGKRLEDGTLVALDVKTGDRIVFGKYRGNEITLDGMRGHYDIRIRASM